MLVSYMPLGRYLPTASLEFFSLKQLVELVESDRTRFMDVRGQSFVRYRVIYPGSRWNVRPFGECSVSVSARI